MSLIKCSECGKDVSDKASLCPFCGNPINSTPVLIEKTCKKWKLLKLIAWIVILFSFFGFMTGYGNGGFNNPLTGASFTFGFLGVITLIVAKLGAWWHHK